MFPGSSGPHIRPADRRKPAWRHRSAASHHTLPEGVIQAEVPPSRLVDAFDQVIEPLIAELARLLSHEPRLFHLVNACERAGVSQPTVCRHFPRPDVSDRWTRPPRRTQRPGGSLPGRKPSMTGRPGPRRPSDPGTLIRSRPLQGRSCPPTPARLAVPARQVPAVPRHRGPVVPRPREHDVRRVAALLRVLWDPDGNTLGLLQD